MESVNLIDAALAGDKDTFMQAFNAAMSAKVHDALELKKVEIASSLIVSPEEVTTDEVQEPTTEVDGTEPDAATSAE